MALDAADLSLLSKLLDQALDLDAAARQAWLQELPPEHVHLLPRLRDLLESRAQADAFMSDVPRIGAGAVDPAAEHAGDRVGPYRLLSEIGQGGMGSVWLAERADGSFERRVALKLPRLTWGDGLAERMAREQRIGALLEHPGIARLYDAGVDALGRPFLAFEFIAGEAIDAWCRQNAVSIVDRLRLILQVAQALAYAHGRLVVHRDIKPSNVLVTGDGRAHLLDFGIAKLIGDTAAATGNLTREYTRVLTPHYAAPEQLRGEPITVQCDVYALGMLTYELLTGAHPYADRGALAVERAVLQGEAPPPSSRAPDTRTAKALRGELDAIVGMALRHDTGKRYASVAAMAGDIERYLAGEPVLARPDSIGYRLTKAVQRHRVAVAAATAVFGAVVAGAAVALVQAQRAAAAAERARAVSAFVVDIFKVNARNDPQNNTLRQLPVEQLLERGARTIATQFGRQPEVQVELYRAIAEIFLNMGNAAEALRYAERAVAALRRLDGNRLEMARVLTLQARVRAANGHFDAAQQALDEALPQARGDDDATSAIRRMRAELNAHVGRYDEAEAELALAERALARIGARPSIERSRAEYLRARMLISRNRFDLARPLFERAIDDAVAVEGPLSMVAIDVRLFYANMLIGRVETVDARRHLEAALASLRDLRGADDFIAATYEAHNLAYMFDETGPGGKRQIGFAEVMPVLDRLAARAAEPEARMPDTARALIDFSRGWAYGSWGQMQRGYTLLRDALPLTRLVSHRPVEIMIIATVAGMYAAETGHHREAADLLGEGLELSNRLLGPQSPYTAMRSYLVARNLMMEGRLDAAETVLDAVPGLVPLPAATPRDPYADWPLVGKVEIRLERGDAKGALDLIARLAPVANDSLHDPVLLRGRALCLDGQFAEGLALMERQLPATTEGRDENHPAVAHLRAVAGQCALAAGMASPARSLALQARRAFEAQPDVAGFYKAPLAELERRLRRR